MRLAPHRGQHDSTQPHRPRARRSRQLRFWYPVAWWIQQPDITTAAGWMVEATRTAQPGDAAAGWSTRHHARAAAIRIRTGRVQRRRSADHSTATGQTRRSDEPSPLTGWRSMCGQPHCPEPVQPHRRLSRGLILDGTQPTSSETKTHSWTAATPVAHSGSPAQHHSSASDRAARTNNDARSTTESEQQMDRRQRQNHAA